jgi:hypothetical protein
MNHNSQQPSHMPLGGPTLLCPLMPLADQYLRIHFNVLQLNTNNQNNLINNEEGIHKH